MRAIRWAMVAALLAGVGCSDQPGDVRGGTTTGQPFATRHPGQSIDLGVQQSGPGSVGDSQQVPPQGLTTPLLPPSPETNPVENQQADAAPTQRAADETGEP